ncbi:MAG: hypothetical protein WCD38_11650 [Candidatus Tumulicola sp.]
MLVIDVYRILAILPVPQDYAPWSWEAWAVNYGSRSPEATVPPMIISRFYGTTELNIMSFGVQSKAVITFAEIEDCVVDDTLIGIANFKLDCALASMNDKYGLPRSP